MGRRDRGRLAVELRLEGVTVVRVPLPADTGH